ncbi:MAG: hypothetical protein J7L23_00750 [Candidatus Diapherotrites archaeon]|nr:hypothetical protein [Candidatus Diapherotrites archaeon]
MKSKIKEHDFKAARMFGKRVELGLSKEEALKVAPEHYRFIGKVEFRTRIGKRYGQPLIESGQKIAEKLMKHYEVEYSYKKLKK